MEMITDHGRIMDQTKITEIAELVVRAEGSLQITAGDALAANLAPGDIVSGRAAEEFEAIYQTAVDLGSTIQRSTLRSWAVTCRRNPPERRNGVSFTAMQEAGDDPRRFEWFAQYGAKLTKRQVRRFRGDRKLDTAATSKHATPQEREHQFRQLLGGMSEEQAMAAMRHREAEQTSDGMHVARQIAGCLRRMATEGRAALELIEGVTHDDVGVYVTEIDNMLAKVELTTTAVRSWAEGGLDLQLVGLLAAEEGK